MIPFAAVAAAPTPARLALGALVVVSVGAQPAEPLSTLGARAAEEQPGLENLPGWTPAPAASPTAPVVFQPAVQARPPIRQRVPDDLTAPSAAVPPPVSGPARFFPATAPRAPPLSAVSSSS